MEQYRRALQDYLAGGGEGDLQRAYELGREALAEGLGILDMATIHAEALATMGPPTPAPEERAHAAKAAAFFMESLSPFEMTHRAYGEARLTLRRLNEMLEEEAKRIAHALHDEAGQLLVSAHIGLAELGSELPPPGRERLQKIRGLLYQIERHLRQLSHELRPVVLDDLGLVAAIEFLAQGVSQRAGFPIAVEGSTMGRLPPQIETALYRIVQEALTNVTKHACPTRVNIRLGREDRGVRCSVQDDGKGFDVAAVFGGQARRGLGLLGIRERVNALDGTLQITSAPGQGTELSITIPVEA